MILVDWQLNQALKEGSIKVVPLMKGAIQPNSIDVRLGDKFATYIPSLDPINPFDKESVLSGLVDIKTTPVILYKGGFLLAETMEYIELPGNVCATIEGKSSLARLGLTVHQTGGWIDCGFKGTITLEMTNENNRPIVLTPGMPIAQIVFNIGEQAKVPYGEKKGAKYQGQVGATGSRYYDNKLV